MTGGCSDIRRVALQALSLLALLACAAFLAVSVGRFRHAARGYDDISADEIQGRSELIRVLRGQVGSCGEILGGDGRTYTEWYIGRPLPDGWDRTTPWCAMFVSWAAEEISDHLEAFMPFADVRKGAELFRSGSNGSWLEPSETPVPGDLVFFDWDDEADEDSGSADHVGVAAAVDEVRQEVVVIEGNRDGAVKTYLYTMSDRAILGYGVLRWK